MENWYKTRGRKVVRRCWIVSCLLVIAIIATAIVALTIQTTHRSLMQSSINTDNQDVNGAVENIFRRDLNRSDDEAKTEHQINIFTQIAWTTLLQSLKKKKCPTPSLAPKLPGKKGVGFTLREEGQPGSWVENIPKVTKLIPYWNYSWGPQRIAQQPNNIEFVPMIWGGNVADRLKEAITTHILPQIKNGTVKRVLGFNEPDAEEQSNMEVSVALNRWKELESMNIPLVSPSCALPGTEWMRSFMKSVDKNCRRIDWVGVHWYGTNFKSFQSAMIKFHDLYDRPILVTEFALADWNATKVSENKISKATTLMFMKEALYWLETQSWIVGYAWFSFNATSPAGTNSALFTEDGTMTTLGTFYASVRTNRPRGDRNII